MLSFISISTISYTGPQAVPIQVEISINPGLPCFNIVGLADKSVSESKDRIKSALHMLGVTLPAKKIVVNLSPANITKEGTHYDLPIAVSILTILEVLNKEDVDKYIYMGELSLDGRISSQVGLLPAAVYANSINKGIISSFSDEITFSGNDKILAFNNLNDLINHFKGVDVRCFRKTKNFKAKKPQVNCNLSNIVGQKTARRCLEIAAAGAHNILFSGPPGTGKSLLASTLIDLLPPLSVREAIETASIYSVSNEKENCLSNMQRPFRRPHNSSSSTSIIGGSLKAKPGEISLAHNGVLFLDELPEFSRACLENLRQPLETKKVVISRAAAHIEYSANFQLIAAMNQCKCGNFGLNNCSKAPRCVQEYQNKISAPIMDRIDIKCNVSSIKSYEINDKPETTEVIRTRTIIAREIQKINYKKPNSELSQKEVQSFEIVNEAETLLNNAMDKLNISMRGRGKIIKIAKTIQDLRIVTDFIEKYPEIMQLETYHINTGDLRLEKIFHNYNLSYGQDQYQNLLSLLRLDGDLDEITSNILYKMLQDFLIKNKYSINKTDILEAISYYNNANM